MTKIKKLKLEMCNGESISFKFEESDKIPEIKKSWVCCEHNLYKCVIWPLDEIQKTLDRIFPLGSYPEEELPEAVETKKRKPVRLCKCSCGHFQTEHFTVCPICQKIHE